MSAQPLARPSTDESVPDQAVSPVPTPLRLAPELPPGGLPRTTPTAAPATTIGPEHAAPVVPPSPHRVAGSPRRVDSPGPEKNDQAAGYPSEGWQSPCGLRFRPVADVTAPSRLAGLLEAVDALHAQERATGGNVQGTAQRTLPGRSRRAAARPSTPQAGTPLRLVSSAGRTVAEPLPAPPQGLEAGSDRWIANLAVALVEIVNGRRQAAQVLRWVSPEVYRSLSRPAPRPSAPARGLQGAPTTPGPRSAQTMRSTRAAPAATVALRRVRVSDPAPGVREGAVVVGLGERSRAVALRVTFQHGRWFAEEFTLI